MTRVVLDPRKDDRDGRFAVKVIADDDGYELDYVGWYDTLDEAIGAARDRLTSEMRVVDVLEPVTVIS